MKKLFWLILVYLSTVLKTEAQGIDQYLSGSASYHAKADSMLTLGKKYHQRFKIDSALLVIDKGLAFALKTDDNILKVNYYVAKSRTLRLKGEFKKALETIKMASLYLDQKTPEIIMASYLLRTGHYYSDLGNADSALYYYREAEKYYSKAAPYENWVVYEGIAAVFSAKLAWDKAEEYLLKGYQLTKAGNKRSDHGTILFMLANLYVMVNKPEKFTIIADEYDNLLSENRKNLLQDPVHSMLFLDWSKYSLEQRVDFLEKAKKSNLSNGYKEGVAQSNYYLAVAYEEAKEYSKALECLQENDKNYIPEANSYLKFINLRHLYRIQTKASMAADALKTAETLLALSGKLSDANSKEIAFNLERKYETEKKQKEIQLLASQNEVSKKAIALLTADKQLSLFQLLSRENEKKALEVENRLMDSIVKSEQAYNNLLQSENDFKTAKLNKEKELMQSLTRENILKGRQVEKERQTKWLLAAGATLVLVSGLSIFLLYKKQKQKSQIIQQQSNDLEVLMKEIHHRVKNNLQVISSLLDLQSMTITDSQASEAVKEGKNRVQSMALIHQNLYSEGNIKGIKTREYISNLLQSLCDSYNITNDKVKVNAEIDDLNLDIDTMIPLGLVLNELVSNSLKYAFKTGHLGELSIILKEEPLYLLLKVSDNGTGYPDVMNAKESKSFGMKMIRAFAQKLKAKLDIYNSNGAVVEMKITKYNLV